MLEMLKIESDQNLVLLFDARQKRKQCRAGGGFVVKSQRGTIANAFSQALRVRQYSDGAQSLRIALQQHALTCVCAKRRGNYFLAQAKLDEIQVGVYLGHL